MNIRVSCYAGYRGEETPKRFWLGSRKIELVNILDRWRGPDHRYFKVVGDDRSLYILRHDSVAWKWEITFFRNEAVINRPGAFRKPIDNKRTQAYDDDRINRRLH